MDLFEYMSNTAKEKESPLAARLRPETFGGGRGAVAYYREG